MRLKERIDELEFRVEAMESALRVLAGTAGVGRLFDDPEVEAEMRAELTNDFLARYAPDLDAESAAEEAEDLLDRMKWLLAASTPQGDPA